MTSMKKIFLLSVISTTLCACSSFFDTDNTPAPTPLTSFNTEARVQNAWNTSTGYGMSKDYLKLVPAVSDRAIATADRDGNVVSLDKTTGKKLWKNNVGASISAGPGVNNNLVVVGTREGSVIALNQTDGSFLWKQNVSSEIMAPPAVADNVVIVKTIDGKVSALSVKDGQNVWNYQQAEPTLTLRGGSAPEVGRDAVIVGFENGNLAKLSLREGSLSWQQTIAQPEGIFSIQRMVDIDANPIISKNHVYVATYQGKIAALDYVSGKFFWSDDISDYAGIAADDRQVYVSDARGFVYAYNAESGAIAWRQNHLQFRNISGPAAIGNYVVVGDAEGYLHWMNKQDGHFVARTKVGGSGILAAPVVSNNMVYVVTKDGHLTAYTIS
jgi:outer membrane protein assembly factor BamB